MIGGTVIQGGDVLFVVVSSIPRVRDDSVFFRSGRAARRASVRAQALEMARGVVVSEVPELGADAEKYVEKGIVR